MSKFDFAYWRTVKHGPNSGLIYFVFPQCSPSAQYERLGGWMDWTTLFILEGI